MTNLGEKVETFGTNSADDDLFLDDFFLAQSRWVQFWEKQGVAIPPFPEFLGLSRAAFKIRMLCGPHWYALLKAYQLSKGNDGGVSLRR